MIHVSKLNDAKAVSEIEFRKLTVSCLSPNITYLLSEEYFGGLPMSSYHEGYMLGCSMQMRSSE
jgi:hypothetical protein